MDPFLGEIRAVPFTFAPNGWAFCEGQLLPISQHTALFSLIGTIYGGDGRTTFALPDLRSRAVISAGQGPGLAEFFEGETGGATEVSLTQNQMPAHSHTLATGGAATTRTAANKFPANSVSKRYAAKNSTLNANAMTPTGGGQPHNNLQPYLVLNYIIAMQGIYPTRS